MSAERPATKRTRASLLHNWISLTGLVVVTGSLFSFLFLCVLDTLAHFSNPYIGILTYFVAPGFLFIGTFLTVFGMLHQWRKQVKSPGLLSAFAVDLSRPRDRKGMVIFIAGTVVFLLVSAIGSYKSYQVSESVQFCGQACHVPMQPEFIAHQNSPHARVACVECHIGHGPEAFVAAKMNGVHQLIGVITDDYARPIKTPIRNLRPARDTCEQCHWPEKFSGNLDRTYQHFLADETNTPFAVRLTLKVGGANPAHGNVGGIHWHVSQDNKIEYVATDDRRQVIPWVRVTNPRGEVTEYRLPGFTNDIATYEMRTMDCLDCHNRPSHRFRSPNDAVDLAITLGSIDRKLPWVKSNAVAALTQTYDTEARALENISHLLRGKYPGAPQADALVTAVQKIYSENFFPEMKADWRAYPENMGHKDWPGCFRCHDGRHKAVDDAKKKIPASDCAACHTILAQGNGDAMSKVNLKGSAFFHIDSEYENADCNSCHTGAFTK